VGDTAGQAADGFHLLNLSKLLLQIPRTVTSSATTSTARRPSQVNSCDEIFDLDDASILFAMPPWAGMFE